eukprot:TRINITY_DN19172_c0_g2_i1.p1 TRINITY_DN19172_c0_g2~~TRINITY_DN19172_c0_g2_i1.p1  ORF type:complete len:277 (-),score=58.15 TRINITY_DN19172_c0_g2_i1:109-909(-)
MAASVLGRCSSISAPCRLRYLHGRQPRHAQWLQRRWWWDADASRKAYDKPAVTASKHIFIKSQIPVVLLESVRGIGQKGQIVSVKRGYARHFLVPKGLAAFGTWENIDAYADPALIDDPTLKARVATERGQLPFDWVDDIRLRFVRWAREDHLSILLEPLSAWDVLEELSARHELDLLPSNLDLPQGGIQQVGLHEVTARIPFRTPESAAGKYTFLVDVLSQQSQEEENRIEEMKRAVEKGKRYSLAQPGGAVQDEEGLEDEEEGE